MSYLVPSSVGLVARIPIADEPMRVSIEREVQKRAVKKPIRMKKVKPERKKRVYELRTACVNGHKLEDGNLYYPKGRRKRECRTCSIERALRAYYKRKELKNAKV